MKIKIEVEIDTNDPSDQQQLAEIIEQLRQMQDMFLPEDDYDD